MVFAPSASPVPSCKYPRMEQNVVCQLAGDRGPFAMKTSPYLLEMAKLRQQKTWWWFVRHFGEHVATGAALKGSMIKALMVFTFQRFIYLCERQRDGDGEVFVLLLHC